jgi:pilus assembly protein Flp/PilA
MTRLFATIRPFRRDVQGVTAIEYALIGLLVAIVIIASVSAIGTNVSGTLTYVAGKI